MSKTEYRQAEVEIPYAVFENPDMIYRISTAVGLITLLGQIVDGQSSPTLPLTIASAATYVIGRIMDRQSTINSLKLQQQAESLNLEHPLYEENLLFPKKLTLEEYVNSSKKTLDYAFAAIVPFFLHSDLP